MQPQQPGAHQQAQPQAPQQLGKAKETQVALHIAKALSSLACFYDILAEADVF